MKIIISNNVIRITERKEKEKRKKIQCHDKNSSRARLQQGRKSNWRIVTGENIGPGRAASKSMTSVAIHGRQFGP